MACGCAKREQALNNYLPQIGNRGVGTIIKQALDKVGIHQPKGAKRPAEMRDWAPLFPPEIPAGWHELRRSPCAIMFEFEHGGFVIWDLREKNGRLEYSYGRFFCCSSKRPQAMEAWEKACR